MDEEDRIIIL